MKTYKYVWAIATVIFSYTSSPQVKISQNVMGGYFFTHTDTEELVTCNLSLWAA